MLCQACGGGRRGPEGGAAEEGGDEEAGEEGEAAVREGREVDFIQKKSASPARSTPPCPWEGGCSPPQIAGIEYDTVVTRKETTRTPRNLRRWPTWTFLWRRYTLK